eukprot:TRINITY_DN13194_c0_g1_i1.p1 TRINITY_DN13194_c0_g1~~TRINITY_DN13194_c0_g1_i1.p1  ORF type:complete len:456 (+),score=45.30 TRINITY_DN13194_c0_g1_i1:99-1466(+)
MQLTIRVIKAIHLPLGAATAIVVYVNIGGSKVTCTSIRHITQPIWNEDINIPISPKDRDLEIILRATDTGEEFGRNLIPIDVLPQGVPVEPWIPLVVYGGTRGAPKLLLRLTATGFGSTAADGMSVDAIQALYLAHIAKLTDLTPLLVQQSFLQLPSEEVANRERIVSEEATIWIKLLRAHNQVVADYEHLRGYGSIMITVDKAINLPPSAVDGGCYTAVHAQLDQQSQETKCLEDSANPEFSETFLFTTRYTYTDKVFLTLRNIPKSTTTTQQHLLNTHGYGEGRVVIPIKELTDGETVDKWYDIKYQDPATLMWNNLPGLPPRLHVICTLKGGAKVSAAGLGDELPSQQILNSLQKRNAANGVGLVMDNSTSVPGAISSQGASLLYESFQSGLDDSCEWGNNFSSTYRPPGQPRKTMHWPKATPWSELEMAARTGPPAAADPLPLRSSGAEWL